MKVSQMVNAACRQLGFTPTAAEAADAMEALNLMLAEWSTSPNGFYRLVREEVTLTAGVGVYAIGPTLDTPLLFGDEYVFIDGQYLYFGSSVTFDNVRPMRIVSAFIRSSDMDYPIQCYYSAQQYAGISNKSQPGMPSRLFYDNVFPTAALLFYPVPDANYGFHFYSQKPLQTYTSLSTDLGLPPEYEPAIKFNLAVDLAEEFGRQLSPIVLKRADDTLKALKRINAGPVPQINTNPFGGCGRRYDIATDTYP